MKELKNYHIVPTEDGSFTLFSKLYNENCHSTSGAINETNLHYIQGCKVDILSQNQNEINVLEIGFGAGVGFKETLKTCQMNQCFLNFISFEIDHELIEGILDDMNLPYLKKEHHYLAEAETFKLMIYYGNARETIHFLKDEFDQKFHAIYQDAFSPKRNAILWTTEWFKDLKMLALDNCIMSTYSSSSSIRKSMLAAGWKIYKGAKFGPKRSSTRAKLKGQSDQDILEHLERSPAGEITDNNFKSYTLKE